MKKNRKIIAGILGKISKDVAINSAHVDSDIAWCPYILGEPQVPEKLKKLKEDLK